jgi:hypothetical protein
MTSKAVQRAVAEGICDRVIRGTRRSEPTAPTAILKRTGLLKTSAGGGFAGAILSLRSGVSVNT